MISHVVDSRWAGQAPSLTSASAPSTTLVVVGTRNGLKALCSGGKLQQGLEPECGPWFQPSLRVPDGLHATKTASIPFI